MTVRLTFSVPGALAEMAERRAAEGQYTLHSNVIAAGLCALVARKEKDAARPARLAASFRSA